jgi:hypothetical protein
MNIVFCRHATRRIAMYGIEADDVVRIVERFVTERRVSVGKHVAIDERSAGRYGFPLKIVFAVEGLKITIVTAYPLKKGVVR